LPDVRVGHPAVRSLLRPRVATLVSSLPQRDTVSCGCPVVVNETGVTLLVLTHSTRLGPYEIVGRLGAGAMGEVYRARDTRLGRDVAVKVLREIVAGDPARQARFEREAKAVAALSHPNILAIHDFGTQDSITYAVMELLEGQTLRNRLAHGPLPWRQAAEVGAAIAEGLAAAHAKGIVHRDLKPENLFLTSEGRVKILDFGLARMTPLPAPPSENAPTAPWVPAETMPGAVMGTPGYMSPEQVRGDPADAPSDIFSLGCVLHEMVSGKGPFRRPTLVESMSAILNEEAPDLTNVPAPAELARMIRHCLAKELSRRARSGHDLALGLRALAGEPGTSSSKSHRTPRWGAVAAAAAALVVVALAAGSWRLFTGGWRHADARKPVEGATAVQAVAILPFENVGGDLTTEFLSDGVTDHLINSLSRVRRENLKIRPFTSVARYKRQKPDVATIGKELAVEKILTGTLRQQGESLSISVALVDARDDNNLWGERYEGKRNEILALQDRVARDVAAHLKLGLSGEEDRRLTKRYTADPEAYLLYREALYHWSKFSPEGIAAAVERCEQAIKKDPDYALAHAALARCYIVLGALHRGPRLTYPKAREHVARALEIDGNLPEAHSAKGVIHMHLDWDWPAAERELEQAIAVEEGGLVPSRNMYGFWLAAHGRLPAALASIRKGQEADPVTAPRRNEVAMCYNWMGNHEQAIVWAQKALEVDAKFFLAYGELGLAYSRSGEHGQAIATLEKGLGVANGQVRLRGMLGYAYAAAGKPAEARHVLDDLKGMPARPFGAAMAVARIHAALGEKDDALKWLGEACGERDSIAIFLKVDPTLESLRGDERFGSLLKEMKLPP
jgi:eukaryotic-like serine/threonine-protein kinase